MGEDNENQENLNDLMNEQDLGETIEEPGKAKYEPAPEVEAVARKLIQDHHSHLVNANIAYMYRRGKWTSKQREIIATAKLVGGVLHYITGINFVILINADRWNDYNQREQEAWIDFALECCCEETTDKGESRYSIQDDMISAINTTCRYGFWSPELKRLETNAKQGRLFDGTGEPAQQELDKAS